MNYTTAGFCNDGTSLDKEQQIITITNNFDFDKVYKVMQALDWKWFDSDEVPTHGRLVNTSSDLLRSCYSEAVRAYGQQYTLMSTGGFTAIARRFESEIYLELSFTVSSVDMRDLA